MTDPKSRSKSELEASAEPPPGGSKCPVPETHRRLAQAHQLWHQVEASYQTPNVFAANLNAAIEALRNVTFILQKEKRAISDFDSWYPTWQARLKDDPLLFALHRARNIVVKERDLQAHSRAQVSILNWQRLPLVEFDVPPAKPTEQIISQFLETVPPLPIVDAEVLAIERRWVAKEFPDQEILEVLVSVRRTTHYPEQR